MRFPLALTAKIAAHIVWHKVRRIEKFATVLQLEPLHTCNLTCTGCGRIREYSTSLKNVMSLEDCLGAAKECNAPMVSICGGEPLIYPKIEALVEGLLNQGRIVYLCTNATLMRRKMREYLSALWLTRKGEAEEAIQILVSEELISALDAEEIRRGPKDESKPVIAPTQWFYWNVHLDGLEKTHDIIVEREGVFREAILAIRMAKILGFQVATNTTVYRETDPQEIEDMFTFLSSLDVDGHTISPGYEYDAAKKDMVARLGSRPEEFFLTRAATREKLAKVTGVFLSHPGLRLEIEGHTDSVGGDDYNQKLSENRAKAVRDYMVQQGISASTIVVKGFGKTKPVASNDNAAGRQRNRRVELVVSGEIIGTHIQTGG